MTDIVKFLTARLDEDEAAAHEDERAPGFWSRVFYPARVLAEVKAKRQRLALYVEVTDVLFHGSRSGDRIKYQRESGRFEALDLEVRRDAALFVEHPDYDPAWRVNPA